MREAITFLMEMLLISVTFFLGYKLIFHHSTPTFRRWYLLAWLVFSFAFPLITIEIPVSSPVMSSSVEDFVMDSGTPLFQEPLETISSAQDFALVETSTPAEKIKPEAPINWVLLISIGYSLVSFALLLRIGLGYFQIWRLKRNASSFTHEGRTVFEVCNSTFKGASFFNWVFIGKSVNERRALVLDHEFVHSGLHHSFDILLSHLYCAFFWINPFAWILKKSIAINTELETDARITQTQDSMEYANLLLELSENSVGAPIINHFSAKHLKMRIMAIKNVKTPKKWVRYFTTFLALGLFFLVSCSSQTDFPSEIDLEAKLYDVKKITTYFTSHQSDTQQKTGKVVSIATFLPNGDLDDLVNKTSYPYDRENEVKQVFWQQPIKKNLPYVMDGLSMGIAERNLLYGNDWPKAYAQHLLDVEAREESKMSWKETYEIDNMGKPTEIKKIYVTDTTNGAYVSHFMPDVTTFYGYEGDKVSQISIAATYAEIKRDSELHKRLDEAVEKTDAWKAIQKQREESEKKQLKNSYTYDGDLLTGIITHSYDNMERSHRFYYDNEVLSKSEYYIKGKLINTRVHYYDGGLKQRTEIFNIDNEPEYTINYEYEFWE